MWSCGGGDICLDPDLEINCDYELFTEQAQKARQLQENRHPSAILALQEALHYYAGDFLPRDRFEDWAAPRRTDLHNLHLDVLGRLARLQQARGDLKAALQTGRQYLELEPADEDMVRLNMEMLSQMGKKQKARSLYKQLAAILEKDFDTVPESETTAMYNDIRP